MTQPRFIYWYRRRKHGEEINQSDRLRVSYAPVYRDLRGIGGFTTREQIGVKKAEFHWMGDRCSVATPATAEGVKQVVRALRPEEAARLDAIDAEIEALHEALKAKRAERREVLKEAFRKGHVVRLAEALEVAEGKANR